MRVNGQRTNRGRITNRINIVLCSHTMAGLSRFRDTHILWTGQGMESISRLLSISSVDGGYMTLWRRFSSSPASGGSGRPTGPREARPEDKLRRPKGPPSVSRAAARATPPPHAGEEDRGIARQQPATRPPSRFDAILAPAILRSPARESCDRMSGKDPRAWAELAAKELKNRPLAESRLAYARRLRGEAALYRGRS